MIKLRIFVSILGLIGMLTAGAHEGHDHGPSLRQAPKGGMMKSLGDVFVEVVAKGKDLKIYFYDEDLAPQPLSGFTVKAKAELPRTKKPEVIETTTKGTFVEASFDAKEAHRYTLLLYIKMPNEDHEDKLKFTIEPKH